MTNVELLASIESLNSRAQRLAKLPPLLAANEAKATALESLAIINELTRREIERGGDK